MKIAVVAASGKVGTIIHVAVNRKYAGHVVISDAIKPYAKEAVADMKNAGVENIFMLTGDTEKIAAKVAGELDIKNYCSELLPADKVSEFEKILSASDGKVAFVGDGINDAPVLGRADVGVMILAVLNAIRALILPK